MKSKGRIRSLSREMSGKYLLQLEADARVCVGYEELQDADVDIILKKHRERRSLDQNALYWAYCSELAHAVGQSLAWMHNKLLASYGYPYFVGGKVAMVVLPDGDESIMQSEEFHVRPTSEVREGKDGTMFRTYIVMRGSSTYNTQEMSRLIDGAEQEARNMGVHLEEHYYR